LKAIVQPLPESLSTRLNQVSDAIAAYLEQRELDDCATELAGAVAAIDCSLEIWNRQLKTELDLQQQFIDSMQQLESRLNDLV
jgi:antirestriction protein